MRSSPISRRAYKVMSVIILVILALLFLFPLYWIVTGAFKTAVEYNAVKPVWWPSEWVPPWPPSPSSASS